MSIRVSDPFGVPGDPSMPFLSHALDPLEAERELRRCYRAGAVDQGERAAQVSLRGIRVVRHKLGRRCLIEYELEVERPGAWSESVTLIGKARSRGTDTTTYQVLVSLWNAGFGPDAEDGIGVPEPAGTIPQFNMWLQRKVPGRVASQLLCGEDGAALGGRIAEAACKLHKATVQSARLHGIADELRILEERLGVVAQARPEWAPRLERLLQRCRRAGEAVREPALRSVHRDFYPDQVIVDGDRLYVVDFDLYCRGDPALDIGNFLGHLTEQSLRFSGQPDALARVEQAFAERFLEATGEGNRPAVEAYAALTLARHIYLSTQFPERRHLTDALLEVTEERLALESIPF